MTFEQFWDGIKTRNGWKNENTLSVSVSGLEKLVKQTWDMAQKSQTDSAAKVNDLLKRAGL